ncbi:MAG: sigma-54 dependent transcriptional regulator [Porticoccaceae bacterium]|nr:sigma-54 dependent transcriptional regulator [Porticoccaceae bacterium]
MNAHQALIVDDEADIRELLNITLSQLGLGVTEAANLSEAKTLLAAQAFDFCLTDMRMPDGSGLELVNYIQQHCPAMPVAVITAHGNTELAVECLKAGAFDFVSKPVELTRLRSMVKTALQLRSEQAVPVDEAGLTGSSPVMSRLREQIGRVARSQAPIFISGESGTGKELVARAIHYLGPRANGPFIPVNCGAIPAELMESEFFGHRKGSFTGAIRDKQGLFQAADGGTLFLDEVADLPLPMQVKLLRAIQEKSVRAIGDSEEKPIDVRILSATHKNLQHEVQVDHFRGDLFYRINVIEIAVPPLRERHEDIPALAQIFLARFASEAGSSAPRLDSEAAKILAAYPFPGNVRELENILERAFTLCSGNVISATDLGLTSPAPTPQAQLTEPTSAASAVNTFVSDAGISLDQHLANIERAIIERTLEENRWNRSASATKLGLTFRQLRYKLSKLGIE